MIDAKIYFTDFLKEKNLNMTHQREIILDTFLSIEDHLSVDELTMYVRKKDPAVGNATVFRTLKLFVDAGIAQEVTFGLERVRYEHKYGHSHHDHLVCSVCGKCIEAVDPRIEILQKELCTKYEFELVEHKLEIFGICKECNQSKQ
ncbi:MAG: transcriptional repressor [Candidatus Margulisiibacteriota bacterium]|nr:MAG: transcriptional repressor [Candidatus Margulisbacteria bacterium GWD2_39_127]OGI04050.1 MAG: transcriptional repressor [Candidatus Margulisbacteria bacterium GWF2_38_17]OGI05993.1 MAG: transcriptional repressor [Candidatus Margulisbacteria bacterium GWE2_39_32]PZM79552.1 MAG: transcriptional repressor [Candidatus Margulisiibacteriota bacterium]HAR63397.1 transcriptional repressor [Candidatus Margulisiibacteriota bacterium]